MADGGAAASAVLDRPDARPENAFLSEDGDVLVTWKVGRRRAVCGVPQPVTWVPHEGWRHGVRREHARAWLLAPGWRYAEVAGSSFLLARPQCRAVRGTTVDRTLVVTDRGRLVAARPGRGAPPPKQGMLSADCPPSATGPPGAGLCQLDPRTGRAWPLTAPWPWWGRWDDATSLLTRPTYSIGTRWSDDGGATWHETWDVWDATVARWAGHTYLFSNGTGGRSGAAPVYRLPEGVDLRSHPHGVGPPDLVDTGTDLPASRDGYRTWSLTGDGVLVGTTSRPVVYVSRGTDWSSISRRPTAFTPDEVVGGFLVARTSRRSDSGRWLAALRVSEDHGTSWRTLEVADVRPE